MTDIAIVIVNHNTCDLLKACLKSVLSEKPSAVVVVDNASSDDSYAFINCEFPTVRWVRNEINLGYGAAANQAIALLTAPYILLLNSDTQFHTGALKQLSDYLDQNPQAAIAGPRLLNVDRTIQVSFFPFPTPMEIFLDVSCLLRLLRFIQPLGGRHFRSWDRGPSTQVPWLVGAALAIRREAFEAVDGFDESFFMYYEEVDLCYRLAQLGWQVHYVPSAEVLHIGSASTQQRRADMIIQFYTSLAHFYRLHYSRWRLAQLTLLVNGIASARLTRDAILLSASRDRRKRAQLADNLAAWRRLLKGEWLRQEVHPSCA